MSTKAEKIPAHIKKALDCLEVFIRSVGKRCEALERQTIGHRAEERKPNLNTRRNRGKPRDLAQNVDDCRHGAPRDFQAEEPA